MKPFPFMLLLICVSLAGCATTDQERVKAFAISAEQGDANAQHNLGVSYQHGIGVHQSSPEALKWFRKAAEQGHVGSQINLGVMYSEGQGVAQDYEYAQWFLGDAYATGWSEVIPQDDAEAIKWMRKAALQGNLDARRYLKNKSK